MSTLWAVEMSKILLVEDNDQLSFEVSESLRAEGYLIDVARGLSEAATFLRLTDYDLLILDWELPDGDGVSLCAKARASKNKDVPILFMTARAALSDKEIGFGIGADDYLTKPFALRELMLRVQALLRRPPSIRPRKLEIRDLVVDLDLHEVTAEGKRIDLFPMEYALFEFLVLHPNQVFAPDALLNRVWPTDSETSLDSLRTTMMRVRQKIGDRLGKPLIITMRNIGYRLEP